MSNVKDTEFAWLDGDCIGVHEGCPFSRRRYLDTISARLYANSATSCTAADP